MTPIKKMKFELKALAANIRRERQDTKNWQRTGVSKHLPGDKSLWIAVPEFRLKHIAYCLVRGRTYEQIESKVHEHNKLKEKHWEKINAMVKAVRDEQEALRPCAS